MICVAKAAHKTQMMALYHACFPGDEAFCTWFFDTQWQPHNSLVLLQDNTVCAMLHQLPLQMEQEMHTVECVYFFALATDPTQQGKGLMSALIAHAFAQCRAQPIDAVALLVQNEALFAFYATQGFSKSFFVSEPCIAAQPLPQGFAMRRMDEHDFEAVQSIYHHATQGLLRGRRTVQEFAVQLQVYDESWVLEDAQGRLQAYSMGGNAWMAQYRAVECLGTQPDKAEALMAALAFAQALSHASWKAAPTAQSCVPQGCIAWLRPQENLSQNTFLNLQYND